MSVRQLVKRTVQLRSKVHSCCRGYLAPKSLLHQSTKHCVTAHNAVTVNELANRSLTSLCTHQTHCRHFKTSTHTLTDKEDDVNLDYALKDPEIKKLLSEIRSDFDNESSISESGAENNGSSSSSRVSDDEHTIDENGAVTDKLSLFGDGMDSVDFEDFGEEVDYEWVKAEKEAPIPLTRGELGVYDIDELVTLLRSENARDLCVIEVPKEYGYVDYLVIVSATSIRHMKSVAEYVRLMHKRKKDRTDKFVQIEGRDSRNWMAMDLGNIALHIFLPDTRDFYDLETLWTCGPEYDQKSKEERDPYLAFPEADFSILQNSYTYPDQPTVESNEPESFESLVYHAPSQEESLRPPKTEH